MWLGMSTASDTPGPWMEARTPPTHHRAVKSSTVRCLLLPRNHRCPSPDCLGRSCVTARKSARMARSKVARVIATTWAAVNCWLVFLRRRQSFHTVWRKVTRKTSQSMQRGVGGYQTEGSPAMSTAGCKGGACPLICLHKSHSHRTAGLTAGHSQNACLYVSSGLDAVECVPTKNPTVPKFITWAPAPAHEDAGHKHPTMPAASPLLIIPGSLVAPVFSPLCSNRHAKCSVSLSNPDFHNARYTCCQGLCTSERGAMSLQSSTGGWATRAAAAAACAACARATGCCLGGEGCIHGATYTAAAAPDVLAPAERVPPALCCCSWLSRRASHASTPVLFCPPIPQLRGCTPSPGTYVPPVSLSILM